MKLKEERRYKALPLFFWFRFILIQVAIAIQPIEALKGTEKFLKVPLRGTFKNFSGSYKGAKRCRLDIVHSCCDLSLALAIAYILKCAVI